MTGGGSATADGDNFCALSSFPTNFYTGEKILSSADLAAQGFEGISQTRHWATDPAYSDGTMGPGWRNGFARLVDKGTKVVLVIGSRHARSWVKNGGAYDPDPDYSYKETLVTSGDGTKINLKDEDGNNLEFYSFTYSISELRGCLYSTTNAYFTTALTGTATLHSFTQPGGSGPYRISQRRQFEQTAGVIDTTTETRLDYAYTQIGSNWQVSAVTLSRIVSSSQQTIRSVTYEYYSSGAIGALQRARVKDASNNTIEVTYYRYNVDVQSQVTPKLIVEGESYERLKAFVGGTDGNVDLASDTTVQTYANLKLTFDTNLRVTSEVVQGVGTVTLSSATDSAHANGVNNWTRKVVETLPNGDQNIVYTNSRAQVVMKVFKSGTLEWRTWYERDSKGRVTMEASPAAVADATVVSLATMEAQPNLVGGTYTYLNNTGLIQVTEYGSSTTATSGTPGDVLGFVKTRNIKNGKSGSLVKQEQTQYFAHASSVAFAYSHTVYPIANRARYRNTDGTGGQTTSFAYTWFVPPSSSESNKIEAKTTTYPIVTTAQNGSNSATSDIQYFDKWSRPTWFKDADGFLQVSRYDRGTGALTQRIRDVQTSSVSDEPSGWVTPSSGGLHLVWNYEFDLLSRSTRDQDPDLRDTYTVYKDADWETRVYPGWTGTATTGPTRVTRKDKAGSYTDNFTTSVTPTSSGGKPTGTETLTGSSLIHRLERSTRDANGRVTQVDAYNSFSGLTYSTSTSLGTLGTHFYRRSSGYDLNGRPDRDVDWTLTILRTVHDGLGRVVSEWIGTDDTPTSGAWSPSNLSGTNTIKTNEYIYDAGGVGNGNLTTSKFFTAAATSLDTSYQYDFRGRQLDMRGPDKVALRTTYDNLNQSTVSETYADTNVNFVIDSTELRGKSETKFDEKGRVYQTIMHHVHPSTGAVGNRLTTHYWANARGARIKTKGPNGEFNKVAYDGAGGTSATFVSYDDGESAYPDADDVAGDTVIAQVVKNYDGAGNLIQETTYERTDLSSKTGDLSVSWAVGDSRRTFYAAWFDIAGRQTYQANYGNNGDTTFTRPSTPPEPNSSDNILVAKTQFDSAGRPYRRLDNKARVTEVTFDMLARATKSVGNYVDGSVGNAEYDSDRTTEHVYDSAGRLSQIKVKNPKGGTVEDQITTYGYGTDANLASPAVWRNDILVGEIYPDSDDTFNAGGSAGAKFANGTDATYDRIEYTYEYASRKLTKKQQDTTTHTYTYDTVGRFSTDQASTLGSGIDGAIRRIEYGYDDLSRRVTVGSYSATSGGTLLNEIRFSYDGWRQETGRTEGHEGTATGAPGYTKSFSDGAVSGEAKYIRLTSMSYPNGRVVYMNYPSSGTVGDRLSRPDNLAHDASGTTKFAQYTYLGLGRIVKVAHPQVTGGLNLDYGTGTGSPTGWDRFGRIIDHKWQTDSAAIKDQYQYGYDRTSNRTFRDNLTANGLGKDQYFVMDGLDRLTTDKRGDLNAGRTDISGTPGFQETWTLEGSGNWKQLVQTTAGTTTRDETRDHTKANETTVINLTAGSGGADCQLDQNGNVIAAAPPGAAVSSDLRLYVYDAWNRMVQNDTSPLGTSITEWYKYDGLHRRIVKLREVTSAGGSPVNRVDYYYTSEWQVVEERELLNTSSTTTVATVPKCQYIWDLRYIDAVVLRDENKDGDGDCVDGTDRRIYYTQDANYNVTSLVETSGTTYIRYLYDAYGQFSRWTSAWAVATKDNTGNELFMGGYRQGATKTYQVRNREYHPTLGRWLQRDPIGYHDGYNLYEYVGARPTGSLDPEGLCEVEIVMPPQGSPAVTFGWHLDGAEKWPQVGFSAGVRFKIKYRCTTEITGEAYMDLVVTFKIEITTLVPDQADPAYSEAEYKRWLDGKPGAKRPGKQDISQLREPIDGLGKIGKLPIMRETFEDPEWRTMFPSPVVTGYYDPLKNNDTMKSAEENVRQQAQKQPLKASLPTERGSTWAPRAQAPLGPPLIQVSVGIGGKDSNGGVCGHEANGTYTSP
ncbi:MAG TPA: RHS repeat-associated core domain-containing protein [Planctomycetota bacterium]